MLIFKQKLPMDTIMPIKVALPFSSSAIAKKSILKLDLQYDYPVMWYQADYETVELGGSDSAEPVSKDYIIASIGTGHDWGDTLTQDHYIGTVMIYGGVLCFTTLLLTLLTSQIRHVRKSAVCIIFLKLCNRSQMRMMRTTLIMTMISEGWIHYV